MVLTRSHDRFAAETAIATRSDPHVRPSRLNRLDKLCEHRRRARRILALVRKPGAFGNDRYREELFPTRRFRMASDALRMALADRQLRAGLLHHSDRGSQYACHNFQ